MPNSFERVDVHRSYHPDRVQERFIQSFTSKKLSNALHYGTVQQSQKWLQIHLAYAPTNTDDQFLLPYNDCYQRVAELVTDDNADHDPVTVIGLGTGSGTKEAALLAELARPGRPLRYYPVDGSLSLAILSAEEGRRVTPDASVQPVVCDLLSAAELNDHVDTDGGAGVRVITSLGVLHNFHPDEFLSALSGLMGPDDLLVLNTNLSPGPDYRAGVDKILPQYNNELTRDWISTILADIGVDLAAGEIVAGFDADETHEPLGRVAFHFNVGREVRFSIGEQDITWAAGDRVRLFYSYRYTTALLAGLLAGHGIELIDHWEAANQEEGVYLCRLAAAGS